MCAFCRGSSTHWVLHPPLPAFTLWQCSAESVHEKSEFEFDELPKENLIWPKTEAGFTSMRQGSSYGIAQFKSTFQLLYYVTTHQELSLNGAHIWRPNVHMVATQGKWKSENPQARTHDGFVSVNVAPHFLHFLKSRRFNKTRCQRKLPNRPSKKPRKLLLPSLSKMHPPRHLPSLTKKHLTWNTTIWPSKLTIWRRNWFVRALFIALLVFLSGIDQVAWNHWQ